MTEPTSGGRRTTVSPATTGTSSAAARTAASQRNYGSARATRRTTTKRASWSAWTRDVGRPSPDEQRPHHRPVGLGDGDLRRRPYRFPDAGDGERPRDQGAGVRG